jgi:hypothetical protein
MYLGERVLRPLPASFRTDANIRSLRPEIPVQTSAKGVADPMPMQYIQAEPRKPQTLANPEASHSPRRSPAWALAGVTRGGVPFRERQHKACKDT